LIAMHATAIAIASWLSSRLSPVAQPTASVTMAAT